MDRARNNVGPILLALTMILATGILVIGLQRPAAAHVITCSFDAWTPNVSGPNIQGTVYRSCNDNPDVSSVTAQLQYYWGGWQDYGISSTTNNTYKSFTWSDWAACTPDGAWHNFRTEGAMDFYHGNWQSAYDTSPAIWRDC